MGGMRVQVKWGAAKHELELDTTRKPLDFKRQIAEVTGVVPEAQQLMAKGSLIKDDGDWEAIGVREGQTLLLMAASRPAASASASAPGGERAGGGCCDRAVEGLRAALSWLWAAIANFFPLLFSFFYTMVDRSAGAGTPRRHAARARERARAPARPPDRDQGGGGGGGADGGGGQGGSGPRQRAAPPPNPCRTEASGGGRHPAT